jgi:hypothetical protein
MDNAFNFVPASSVSGELPFGIGDVHFIASLPRRRLQIQLLQSKPARANPCEVTFD